MVNPPSKTEFRKQLREVEGLSTLPHMMERLTHTAADPTAGASELGKIIAEDQSLTSQVLKVANSAFYGRPGGIANLADAIVLLGLVEVERLALSMSVMDMFAQEGKLSEQRITFWLHSFHTAGIAELIDADRGRGMDGAFTLGLLHDLGRVVLDQYFPDVFAELQTIEERTGRPAVAVEEELLGYTHAHIGFWLAERWRFPPVIGEAIRFHHTPSNSLGAARLTAMVHIGDVLAHRRDDGPAAATRDIHPAALAQLDLMPSELPQYMDKLDAILTEGDSLARDLLGLTD